jgi:hypothetical protein
VLEGNMAVPTDSAASSSGISVATPSRASQTIRAVRGLRQDRLPRRRADCLSPADQDPGVPRPAQDLPDRGRLARRARHGPDPAPPQVGDDLPDRHPGEQGIGRVDDLGCLGRVDGHPVAAEAEGPRAPGAVLAGLGPVAPGGGDARRAVSRDALFATAYVTWATVTSASLARRSDPLTDSTGIRG